MKHHLTRPHPDLIAGVVVILASVLLMLRAGTMPAMTALLPFAMLGALIVLSLVMIVRALMRDADPETARPDVFDSRNRFFGVCAAIGLYVAAVALIGFYTSTVIMIPAVSWAFGFRKPVPLALATAIFVGGIALIFHVLMGQDLPAEFFAR
ncbi:hypothetical protein ATO8_07076 [Roseivivax marinus]|jgi:hypothetical protein|uniref:DUF1468 domain-containing protein n=1 Tax=Roseivivax marinus TaxID=1379903 RepID=W4HLW7_9RHOB|nr:tripartite tricarboxylate transporter TctB family protein [Roseivivax marinus]ETW13772.1 hypothetical protein ATO8_07076 [Roseivivax marinus]